MQAIEFLQQIFPKDSGLNDDHIRFLVIGPEQPWPGKVYWRTREEIHKLSPKAPASAIGFDIEGKDVYFTPHAFTITDRRVDKGDATECIDVAWVECDDEDLIPEMFSPPPSIIVETSPRRHHLYWLLDNPTNAEDVERINWRLIHGNNLRKDTGGWHLVKLLRLPGTFSYKRPQPTPVQVKGFEPERRYKVPESFNDLPEAPENFNLEDESQPIPDINKLPTRKDLEEKYVFPVELNDILVRERDDRSIALWRAYNVCYRLGMDERECFALIRTTPNDKFTRSWRYNQDAGLWSDITRGFRYAKHPDDTPALLAIRTIRATKDLPTIDKRKKIADVIIKDLTQKGRVYFDPQTLTALYYDGRQVIEIDRTHPKWRPLMTRRYNCPPGESDYPTINDHIYTFAVEDGEQVTPHTFSYYDRKRNLLYVYNNGGKVFRLDGQIIETVDNGTDGILFRDNPERASFEPVQPLPYQAALNGHNPPAPTMRQAIFGIPNYEDNFETHTAKEATDVAEAWFYSMFFGELLEARPHLVVNGSTDSGKTMMFQLMEELLNGPNQTVTALPTDRANFENAVSNAHHLFFDNVDTPNKWLQDAIAECATGIRFSRRILYTTNATASYNVKCFLGLTTREAWFSREDVATRLLVLNTVRRKMKMESTTLIDNIRDFRPELWYEILTNLNRVVAALEDRDKEATYNLRMASFQIFLRTWAAINDSIEPHRLEHIVSKQQVSSALDNSIVYQLLHHWLLKRDRITHDLINNGRKVTADELHRDLRSIATNNGTMRSYDGQVRSPMSLGRKLKELSGDLLTVAEMEVVRTKPRGVYRFTLTDPPSYDEEVADALEAAATV